MSVFRAFTELLVARLKRDPAYRLDEAYSTNQLATILWWRGWQLVRGAPLKLFAHGVRGPVFRGRRVVLEHAAQLRSGAGLILEDGVFINALSTHGITLGCNVTIARGATLVCTGVIASIGFGMRIGDRSAVGAGSFLGGQGGITIGNDVIIGPGVRIISENHRVLDVDRPIRSQGESRLGVSIADDCWIGAGAILLDGVSIGTGSVVAAGAVVTRSIAPYSVVAGIPARLIRTRGAPDSVARGLREDPTAATESRARIPSSQGTE